MLAIFFEDTTPPTAFIKTREMYRRLLLLGQTKVVHLDQVSFSGFFS